MFRSNIRPTMVDEGLINWLVTSLRGFDGMSDYMLEYAVALLMNLTILSYGLFFPVVFNIYNFKMKIHLNSEIYC